MRCRLATLAVFVVILALPGFAFATLIQNEDNRDHTIKLEQGSGSVSSTVKANRAVSFRCAKFPCTISLGESSLKIRNAKEDVIIRDGKLVRRPRVATNSD